VDNERRRHTVVSEQLWNGLMADFDKVKTQEAAVTKREAAVHEQRRKVEKQNKSRKKQRAKLLKRERAVEEEREPNLRQRRV